MGLETGTYISDLVATNPVGATDAKSQGDDHIRLLKATIKATFANVAGAVTASHTELNYVHGVTGVEGTGKLVLAASSVLPALSGVNLTALVAGNITAGGTLPALNGAALTALTAANITGSHTLPDGVLSTNVPLLNAANVFSNATNKFSAAGNARVWVDSSDSAGTPAFVVANAGTAKAYFGCDATGSISGANDALILGTSSGLAFSGNTGTTVHFRLSSTGVLTTPGVSSQEVGFQGLPVVTVNADISASGASHNGRLLYVTASGKKITLTSGLPAGFAFTVINNSGGNFTLEQGSGSGVYLAGTGWTGAGNRTVAHGGMAFVAAFDGANYLVSGAGVS